MRDANLCDLNFFPQSVPIARGTGFVSKEDLPKSEDDEEDDAEARAARVCQSCDLKRHSCDLSIW